MVEIIPKEAPKLPKWLNILFYVLIFLFIASIVLLFILNSSLNNSLENLSILEANLAESKTEENLSLESEILEDRLRLQDFSIISDKHPKVSEVFSLVEGFCHPQVWFLDFKLDTGGSLLTLTGETENFKILGQQMSLLQNAEGIESYKLSQASINDNGRVGFILLITLSPGLLK